MLNHGFAGLVGTPSDVFRHVVTKSCRPNALIPGLAVFAGRWITVDGGPNRGRWPLLLDPQLLQLVPQRPERDAQLRGGPGLVVAVVGQCLLGFESSMHGFHVRDGGAVCVPRPLNRAASPYRVVTPNR